MAEVIKKSTQSELLLESFSEKNINYTVLIQRLDRISSRLNRTMIPPSDIVDTDSFVPESLPSFESKMNTELSKMGENEGKLETLIRGLEEFI